MFSPKLAVLALALFASAVAANPLERRCGSQGASCASTSCCANYICANGPSLLRSLRRMRTHELAVGGNPTCNHVR
jgi:hypothetical protein